MREGKRKVGLLMGTFDPIHIGHVSVITEALNVHGLDHVRIVPAWHNPWKGVANASFDNRYGMCIEVACELQQFYCSGGIRTATISVSSIEEQLHDRNLGNGCNGGVYSSDVIRAFMRISPDEEIYILCGSDVASQIKDWHEGDWIMKNVGIIEIGRIGETENLVDHGIKVSSTAVRKILSEGKCPVPYVPASVYNYIQRHGLYLPEGQERYPSKDGVRDSSGRLLETGMTVEFGPYGHEMTGRVSSIDTVSELCRIEVSGNGLAVGDRLDMSVFERPASDLTIVLND